MEARSYKIVDGAATKTVGLYRTLEEAKAALERLRRLHPESEDDLVIVTMDGDGTPLESADRGSITHPV